MKRRTLYAAFIIFILSTSGCSLAPKEEVLPNAPVLKNVVVEEYKKVSVVRGDITDSTVVECTYTAFRDEKFNFPGNGHRLTSISVEKGDMVEKGQVMAEVELQDLMTQILNKKNAIESIEMKIAQAEELKQWAQNTRSALSVYDEYNEQMNDSYNQEIENQDNTLSKLMDDLRIEELRLESLEDDVRSRKLIASWDGIVASVASYNEWETATKDKTYITLYDPETMVFVTNGKFSELFQVGDQLIVTVADMEYVAQVISSDEFAESLDQNNVGKEVYLRIISEGAQPERGDRGTITFVHKEYKDVLYLQSSVVLSDNGKYLVYVEDESGFKVLREIEVETTVGDKYIIKSGLNDGDSVIMN